MTTPSVILKIESDSPPASPDADRDWLQRDTTLEPRVGPPSHTGAHGWIDRVAETVLSLPGPVGLPLSMVREDESVYIVTDVYRITYGSGPTPEEAISDYVSVAAERVQFLREHYNELSPKLTEQLHQLEHLFPHL